MFTIIFATLATMLSVVSVGIVLADKSARKSNPISFPQPKVLHTAEAEPEDPYFPALSAWDRAIQGLPPVSSEDSVPQYAPSPVRTPKPPVPTITGATSLYPYDRREWVLETMKRDAEMEEKRKAAAEMILRVGQEKDTYSYRSLAVSANVRPTPSTNSAQLRVLYPGKAVRIAGYVIGETVSAPDGSFASPVWFVLKDEQSVVWSGVFHDKKSSGLPRYDFETQTLRSYDGRVLYTTGEYQKFSYPNPFS